MSGSHGQMKMKAAKMKSKTNKNHIVNCSTWKQAHIKVARNFCDLQFRNIKKYKLLIIITWCKFECTILSRFFLFLRVVVAVHSSWSKSALWICIKCARFFVNIYSEGIKVSCSTSAQNRAKEKNKKKRYETNERIHINVYTNKIVTFICILCTVI